MKYVSLAAKEVLAHRLQNPKWPLGGLKIANTLQQKKCCGSGNYLICSTSGHWTNVAIINVDWINVAVTFVLNNLIVLNFGVLQCSYNFGLASIVFPQYFSSWMGG